MQLEEQLLAAFLVFCRVGACLMIVPGLSGARVPIRVRLYLALAIALTIAPLVERGSGERLSDSGLVSAIFAESLVGLVIGGVSRLFIEAIEFSATAIANYIGLTWLSAGFDSGEAEPTLTTLFIVFTTLLLMLMDFPHLLIAAIVNSYVDLPIGIVPDSAAMLRLHVDTLSAAFLLGLQISGPFLVYGIVLNAMFGILGKLVPQMPTFFISAPFIGFGGLLLLYFVSGQLMQQLESGLSAIWK